MALPRAQVKIFQLHGFVRETKEELEKLVWKLERRVLSGKVYNTHCTHLIIRKPSLAEKYLSACAAGIWILREEYLRESASAGFWLPEEPYEWGNPGYAMLSSTSGLELASYQWRRHIQSGGSMGAFQDWIVMLDMDDMSRIAIFSRILKAGMAVVYEGRPSAPDTVVTHILNEMSCDTIPLTLSCSSVPRYNVRYIADYLLKGPPKDGNEDKCSSTVSKLSESMHSQGLSSAASEQNHLSSQTRAIDPENETLTKIQNDLTASNKSFYLGITSGCVRIHPTDYSEEKPWLLDALTAKNVEMSMECGFYSEALQEVEGYLTRSALCCPPAGTLQKILKHILKQGDEKLMERFCKIFDLLLAIYPPWAHCQFRDYYLRLLGMPDDTNSGSDTDSLSEACWAVLKTVISTCGNAGGARQNQQVYRQFLVCFCKLFEAELFELNARMTETGSECSRPRQPSVLAQVFCASSDCVTLAPKRFHFFLAQLSSACCRRTPQQGSSSISAGRQQEQQLLRMVQCVLGVVLEFSLLWNRDRAMEDIKRHANQMAIECLDYTQHALETLVRSLTSPWLRMHVCDKLLCHSFVHNKSEIMKMPLSLSKIKTAYFCITRFSVERVSRQEGTGYSATDEVDNSAVYDGVIGRVRNPSKRTTKNGPEDVHVPSSACKSINPKGETLLHKACIKNDVAKLKQLLESPGTDINVQDCTGWTPLHDACYHGSLECVRVILRSCHNADLHASVGGRTPLSEASSRGHGDIATLLRQHGAEEHRDGENLVASCANLAAFAFLLKQLLHDYLRQHRVLELLQSLWPPGDRTEDLGALRGIATNAVRNPGSRTEEVERRVDDLAQVLALRQHVPGLKAFLTEVAAPEALSAKTEDLLRAIDCEASLPQFLGYAAQ